MDKGADQGTGHNESNQTTQMEMGWPCHQKERWKMEYANYRMDTSRGKEEQRQAKKEMER